VFIKIITKIAENLDVNSNDDA